MAIAYDSSAFGEVSGVNSVTYSHTCTGSNLVLYVGIMDNGGGSISSVTYNTVAMTSVGVTATKDAGVLYLYYLAGPATGAHNVVVTRSNTTSVLWSASASYTGASQTGIPDQKAKVDKVTATSITAPITTIANNCWLVGFFFCDNGGASAGANTTLRQNNSTQMADSNAAKTPAGAYSLILNCGNGGNAAVIASFAPAGAAGATLAARKTLLGVGI